MTISVPKGKFKGNYEVDAMCKGYEVYQGRKLSRFVFETPKEINKYQYRHKVYVQPVSMMLFDNDRAAPVKLILEYYTLHTHREQVYFYES